MEVVKMLMTEKMQIEIENLKMLLEDQDLTNEYKIKIALNNINNMLNK